MNTEDFKTLYEHSMKHAEWVVLPIAETKIYAPRYQFLYWAMGFMNHEMHATIASNKLLNWLFWKEAQL